MLQNDLQTDYILSKNKWDFDRKNWTRSFRGLSASNIPNWEIGVVVFLNVTIAVFDAVLEPVNSAIAQIQQIYAVKKPQCCSQY